MERSRDAGFTLVDLLLSVAIAAVLLMLLVEAGARLAAAASGTDARVQAQSAANRLAERLTSEAASAWSIFVPAADLKGASNADGHEIDVVTEDASHRTEAWAYTYDPASKLVTRYAYVNGGAISAGERMGPFDAFSATAIAASRIAAIDPLFAGASIDDVSFAIPSMPSAKAGNALVRLHVVARGVDRTVFLAAASAPATFTVVVTYTPSPAPLSTATPTAIPFTLATP